MSATGTHAVVIGGGAIGAASAWYLSLAGYRVTVVEAGAWGRGASHGNCGLVSRTHVLPLTEPGAVALALKSMFKKDAPFRIKPRVDFALWGWLIRFARNCNREYLLRAARVREGLLVSSMTLYEELIAREGFDCEWEKRGCLSVFRKKAGMDSYQNTVDLLASEFRMPATAYDGDGLCAIEPACKPGLFGGFLHDMDAHLRPSKLMSAWRGLLTARGVVIHEHSRVTALRNEGGQVRAVSLQSGAASAPQTLDGDVFVIAAGALAPRFRKELGCAVPIQPGKGYSLTMPRPQPCPTRPIYFREVKVVATPMKSGYRLGSTMEFAGYDESLPRARLDYLRRMAEPYLLAPTADPIEEEWFGWRPMTHDGLPIIGRVPAANNVCLAAGHNMEGISMSPATGKLVAEILSGATPHLDPEPFSPTRF